MMEEAEEEQQVEVVFDAFVHLIHHFFDERVRSYLYSLEYALFALAPVVVEQDDEEVVVHNNLRPSYELVKQRILRMNNLPQVGNNHPQAPVLLFDQDQTVFESLPIHFHLLVCVEVAVVQDVVV